MGAIRDAARTRGKIVEAAAQEFAAKGFAGARMDGIARRAKVNKQLLYHYFANKEALFDEIVESVMQHKETTNMQDCAPGEVFAQRFLGSLQEQMWLRFVTWESAEFSKDRKVAGEARRTKTLLNQRNALIARQFRNEIDPELDVAMLQLAIQSLSSHPVAFAPATKMITGHWPTEAAFKKRWIAFLKHLGNVLLTPPKADAPKQRNGEGSAEAMNGIARAGARQPRKPGARASRAAGTK